jgi:hypothetical protein
VGIGSADIEIGVVGMVVPMIMIVVVMVFGAVIMEVSVNLVVIVVIVKQESAEEVDYQAENRDRNRLAIFDINGMDQAHNRLVSDQQGDHREDDGAAKCREVT